MNRQIKFRVWDGKKLHDEHSQDTTIDFKGRWSVSIGGQYICDFRNGILSQFTGLKDKNGKDIYEGDIVKYILPNDWDDGLEIKQEVKYNLVDACFEPFSNYYVVDNGNIDDNQIPFNTIEFEVIGNIFENPELLTNK